MGDSRALLTQGRGSHAGQVLLRGLAGFASGDAAAHVGRVADIPAPEAYRMGFGRFASAMATIGAQTHVLKAEHPIAIGLGNQTPIEVGITLHPTYGVPLVPGKALKNVAKRAAVTFDGVDQGARDQAVREVFGSPELAGGIEFWGGWVLPDQPVLAVDVMTPHHQYYYMSAGGKPATDFDDPNPVSFLVIPKGCKVLFALGCSSSAEWARLAWDFASHGLYHLGVGGKTNVGYGTFCEV